MGLNTKQRSRLLVPVAILAALLALAGCSGPDQFGGDVTTPTVTPSPVATAEPTPAPEPSPTSEPEADPTPTVEPEPTATEQIEEPTATAEPEPTPEPEPTATEEPQEPTPTPEPVPVMEALPILEELSEAGYVLANQGDRTADQLAQAYIDAAAHAARLEEWGFRQHVFREFTLNASGQAETHPHYVLATVNVYGSAEQAELALQWLERLQVSQGAVVIDPPDVGDEAIAMSQRTTTDEDVAWVVFRHDDRVYIYYAQGNEAMAEALSIAANVYDRLTGAPETV